MKKIDSIKTSLIITVYNRVHLLRKSLISLSKQSILPDELIISDDGSDEDIISGINDIVEKLDFPIKYVSQPNRGFRLSKVRNNGVRISAGELLIFLDQDIIYTKDFLMTFVENMREGLFLTAYPIRLDETQSRMISESVISDYDFLRYIKHFQINKIRKQYLKDLFSYLGAKIGVVQQKPKLRGGVCAINRKDYFLVNGYDEMFQGWGNEDDDIRKRLYNAGVKGFNPFIKDFPLHLYHELFHKNGLRVNQSYVDSKKQILKSGYFKCEYGIMNPLIEDEIKIKVLK
ncbi:MAG: glycosyltransferase [Ignavibacteriales bacterium]